MDAPLIYVVDDMPCLTCLYSTFLEETGYVVRTFNSRVEALTVLKMENKKPDLLIMDYLGHSMPAEKSICHCRAAHPALRILLASGVDRSTMRFSRTIPDRFLPKPFTLEELRQGVRAALARE